MGMQCCVDPDIDWILSEDFVLFRVYYVLELES